MKGKYGKKQATEKGGDSVQAKVQENEIQDQGIGDLEEDIR